MMCSTIDIMHALTLYKPSMVLLNFSTPSILEPKMGAISTNFLLRMSSARDDLPARERKKPCRDPDALPFKKEQYRKVCAFRLLLKFQQQSARLTQQQKSSMGDEPL